jgi:uncharacterized protein
LKKLYLSALFICIVLQSFAQVKFISDHKHYLKILGSAKDSLYEGVLSQYNRYIQGNPLNVKVQIEQCRFIQNAYYDSYEDYNPKEEEAQACAEKLIANFPEQPEALLLGSEFIYGDTLQKYLNFLERKIQRAPTVWIDHDWQVYEKLANYFQYDDDREVIQYAELAQQKNDTLDLSLSLARAHKNLSNNEKAIEVLLQALDSTDEAWELNQKGKLLLELGKPDQAIKAFKFASADTSAYQDDGALAQAMIDNGLGAEARPYLLKQYQGMSWNKSEGLRKLLEYDFDFSPSDSVAATYIKLTNENFWNDPFGIYRLKLLTRSPLAGWSFADFGRIALFILLFAVLFIIPYLWILPMHYFGELQRRRGISLADSPYTWGLTHFWVACSLWLACDVISELAFDYAGFVSIFHSDINAAELPALSKINANLNMTFWTGCFVFIMGFLTWDDIKRSVLGISSQGGSIVKGLGLAFLLKFGLGIYTVVLKSLGFSHEDFLTITASVNDDIISVNTFYSPLLGFLFVVILVPIYEEILFRGIFLSACQRNMRFILANALQSLVFALIHQRLMLIPFYFAFGYVAGHFRQKTGSMVTGVSMHMTNNLIAFLAMLARS